MSSSGTGVPIGYIENYEVEWQLLWALLYKSYRNTSLCIFSKAIYAHLSWEANYAEGISQGHFSQRQEIVTAVEIMDCELEFRGCFRNAVL